MTHNYFYHGIELPGADPARVISRSDTDRWLEERRKVLTATQVPVLYGTVKWDTEDTLRAKRAGQLEDPVNKYMFWGSHSEAFNLITLCRLADRPIQGMNVLLVSKTAPWLAATPDAVVVQGWGHVDLGGVLEAVVGFPVAHHGTAALPPFTEAERAAAAPLGLGSWHRANELLVPGTLVELKNVSGFTSKAWREGVPEHYWQQVQVQLFVSGLTRAAVVAKLGSADMVVHMVDRDDLWCEDMVDRTRRWVEQEGNENVEA